MSDINENKNDVEVTDGEIVRAIFTDMAYTLFDMCRDIGITDVKLVAERDTFTGEGRFKAKVEGNEVLSIKSDEHLGCF